MEIYDFLKYFSRIITMLLVLPLHECAHALVAKWLGDDTAERQGRITLNPFSHLDPIGAILMLFTGFGWAKPVQVNPMRMKKYRAGFALTALAGPVSNIIAAFVAALARAIILSTEAGISAVLKMEYTPLYCTLLLLEFLVVINVGLAVFNLIPLPPLDGFNVLRYFTNEKFDRWFYTHQREISYGFLIFILFLNMDIIPAKYNLLYIAQDGLTDLILKCVNWIPEKKWGI
ncbi:MAG: site-2 protease family protein [Ruminococcus sp.]|nr:site-2 protease family protein [Ruminococcus sp.]